MAWFEAYTTENEVLRYYLFYTALMFLKMMFVVLATGVKRFQKGVFANPEDTKIKGGKVNFADQDVERIRRIHLNDMENIYLFAIVGLLYVGTNPSPFLATLLYRVFAYSRIVHTLVYMFAVPQPSRAISFIVGVAINVFMAVSVMKASF